MESLLESKVTEADLFAPIPVGSSSDRDPKQSKILVIDDVPINLKVVQAYLEQDGYSRILTSNDPRQGLAMIYREHPDLILLDIMMPEVSGLDILRELREDATFSLIPVVILTGSDSRELKQEALALGATDFLAKPVDPEDLLPRVKNVLIVKQHQDNLEELVRQRTVELDRSRREIIHCLARAAEYRDNETGRHVLRVGSYVGMIAEQLGIDADQVDLLKQASILHDVGKIGIPDSILLKQGKLTPEEYQTIRRHCGYGKHICEQMSSEEYSNFSTHTSVGASILSTCHSPVLELASTIALTHHEWWNGEGYPLGLAGEDIPLEGRITAVADVFDALSSQRPYKSAFALDKCFRIMEEARGTQFDPQVLDAFFARQGDVVSVQIKYADVD